MTFLVDMQIYEERVNLVAICYIETYFHFFCSLIPCNRILLYQNKLDTKETAPTCSPEEMRMAFGAF